MGSSESEPESISFCFLFAGGFFGLTTAVFVSELMYASFASELIFCAGWSLEMTFGGGSFSVSGDVSGFLPD